MRTLLIGLAFLFVSSPVFAQQPLIAYTVPAGGQQGTTVEVLIGGRNLSRVVDATITGEGIQVEVLQAFRSVRVNEAEERAMIRSWVDESFEKLGYGNPEKTFFREPALKPEDQKPDFEAAKKAREARLVREKKRKEDRLEAERKAAAEAGLPPTVPREIDPDRVLDSHPFLRRLHETPNLPDLRWLYNEYFMPRPRPPQNPSITNAALLKITIAANAEPGDRELRVLTVNAISRPVLFRIGTIPEIKEVEPNEKAFAAVASPLQLPIVINGQIREGDVDGFRFFAKKGQKLLVSALGRYFVPYMADAVPGWFQPVVTLYDPDGKEAAYADSGGIRPDPYFYYDVPREGIWTLEVQDSLFRGRDDFVYRISIGELPWVEGIFPLGGEESNPLALQMIGRNLPTSALRVTPEKTGMPSIHSVERLGKATFQYPVLYATDTLPEMTEKEPNDAAKAQEITLPTIVNGRIGAPGDADVYKFTAKKGEKIVIDMTARQLNSPLDGMIRISDTPNPTAIPKPIARDLPSTAPAPPEESPATTTPTGSSKEQPPQSPPVDFSKPFCLVVDDRTELNIGRQTHQADPFVMFDVPKDGDYYVRVDDANGRGGPAYSYRLRISAPRDDFDLFMEPSGAVMKTGQTIELKLSVLRRDGFQGAIALKLLDAGPGFKLSGGPIPAGENSGKVKVTAPSKTWTEPFSLQIEGAAQTAGGKIVRRLAVACDDHEQAFIYHHLIPSESVIMPLLPEKVIKERQAERARRSGKPLPGKKK